MSKKSGRELVMLCRTAEKRCGEGGSAQVFRHLLGDFRHPHEDYSATPWKKF